MHSLYVGHVIQIHVTRYCAMIADVSSGMASIPPFSNTVTGNLNLATRVNIYIIEASC